MVSVHQNRLQRHILTSFFALMSCNELDMAEIEKLWLSHIEVWGPRFTSEFHIGWMDSRDVFMLFLSYHITLYKAQAFF